VRVQLQVRFEVHRSSFIVGFVAALDASKALASAGASNMNINTN
jgi:hypothetical protein